MRITLFSLLICTLNILNAQFVPDTRTLTINGTTQDLSANRTWAVGDLLSTGSYLNPTWLTGISWDIISGVPDATTSISGVVNTTIQTFGGAKTFNTSLSISGTSGNTFALETSGFVYDASNNRIGINKSDPGYFFDLQAPSSTVTYYAHRNSSGNESLLIDFDSDNIRWGLMDAAGNTTVKLRSNSLSYVKNNFMVGNNENLDGHPQFKVVGVQDYINGPNNMVNYQMTVQNQTDTEDESASIGFGVDANKSAIGGYISFVRADDLSKGAFHFGVYNGGSLSDILVLDNNKITLPTLTASRIAVINSSQELTVGTIGSGLSLSSDVLSMNISGLTEETNIDRNADYVAIYDASAGTIDKAKTSNLALGITLQGVSNGIDPVDDDDFYIGAIPQITGTTANLNRVYIPKSGIVKAVYVYFVNGTPATSSESSTIYLKINNTIFSNLGTITNNAGLSLISNTSVSQSVNQGDYLEIKWECPNWSGTPPSDVSITFVVYIE